MAFLKPAVLPLAVALALGLGSAGIAAPLGSSRSAVGTSAVADAPIVEVQTPGMYRRADRRMGRHERRMDRRTMRHDRRMDRRYGY